MRFTLGYVTEAEGESYTLVYDRTTVYNKLLYNFVVHICCSIPQSHRTPLSYKCVQQRCTTTLWYTATDMYMTKVNIDRCTLVCNIPLLPFGTGRARL